MIAGFGIGLRRVYAADLLRTQRQVDFVEITPENWLFHGGTRERTLRDVIARYPTVSHSVSLTLGGTDAFDAEFIDALKRLHSMNEAPFFSDHLCYSSVNGRPLNDLLPLPFSEEAAAHVVRRIREAEARVERPFVMENATFYATMPGSHMSEATFVKLVLEASGCGLLLDVNNVYVNAQNHGYDAQAFIDAMPMHQVKQIHVAGHTLEDDVIIDTHIGPTPDPVWALYRYAIKRAGRVIPTIIEWDAEIPALDVVLDELDLARAHCAAALGGQ